MESTEEKLNLVDSEPGDASCSSQGEEKISKDLTANTEPVKPSEGPSTIVNDDKSGDKDSQERNLDDDSFVSSEDFLEGVEPKENIVESEDSQKRISLKGNISIDSEDFQDAVDVELNEIKIPINPSEGNKVNENELVDSDPVKPSQASEELETQDIVDSKDPQISEEPVPSLIQDVVSDCEKVDEPPLGSELSEQLQNPSVEGHRTVSPTTTSMHFEDSQQLSPEELRRPSIASSVSMEKQSVTLELHSELSEVNSFSDESSDPSPQHFDEMPCSSTSDFSSPLSILSTRSISPPENNAPPIPSKATVREKIARAEEEEKELNSNIPEDALPRLIQELKISPLQFKPYPGLLASPDSRVSIQVRVDDDEIIETIAVGGNPV